MTTLSTCAWVTSAVTEDEARCAAVLSNSLRRVGTSLATVVIASSMLEKKSREHLATFFDLVLFVSDDLKPNSLAMDDFAKMSVMGKCTHFDKCVYLSPKMEVARNVDEIFEEGWCNEDPVNGIFSMVTTSADCPWESDFFLFWPTMLTYWKLVSDVFSGGSLQLEKPVTGSQSILAFKKHGEIESSVFQQQGSLDKLLLDSSTCFPVYQPLPASFQHKGWETEPVAIIGMSCRFPHCRNLREFWKILIKGESALSNPPDFRWRADECLDPSNDFRTTKAGFLIDSVRAFDHSLFNISPKEATVMDPQLRLLLEVACEALEDASISTASLRGTSTSVFTGSWNNDYRPFLRRSSDNRNTFTEYICNSFGSIAARISLWLGCTGPSVAIESGCSSSMMSLHLACKSLRIRETNLALAAGVNLLLRPFDHTLIPQALSSEGSCKTFCERADGYARAEGCGVLVLKRLSDAINDGDNIWGLVRGSGCSQDGMSQSLGTPTVGGESIAMIRALEDAEIQPYDVSYVEAHGTGTLVGDPIEIAATAKAYNSQKRKEPLIIGSVKTNIGHTESCSGIAGVIKTLLAMQYRKLPPHTNFEKLNTSVNLEAVPAVLLRELLEWKSSPRGTMMAGVSSFGMTATNTHVILEKPPETVEPKMKRKSERTKHILKISAKSTEALQEFIIRIGRNMEFGTSSLADIAYSLNTGRPDFNWRAIIIAQSKNDVAASINSKSYIFEQTSVLPSSRKICFVFGRDFGTAYNSSRELYLSSPSFRNYFDYCATVIRTQYNIFPTKLLLNNDAQIANQLHQNLISFCIQYSTSLLWKSWGVRAEYALGCGLNGELAAAVFSGILSVEDAITLLVENNSKNIKVLSSAFETCKFISPSHERQMKSEELGREYWAKCTDNCLDASDDNGFQTAAKLGCKIFIQITTDSKIATPSKKYLHIPSISDSDDVWKVLLGGLGKLYLEGESIDWQGYDSCYSRKKVRNIPHYPFQRKEFWPSIENSLPISRIQNSLLGDPISTPRTPQIFQSQINLDSHGYLQDHTIGSTVIFPGAGYVAMFIEAAAAVVPFRALSGNFPLALQNIAFEVPLGLSANESVMLQTVTDTPYLTPTTSSKIYQNIHSEWLFHASATIRVIKRQKSFDYFLTEEVCQFLSKLTSALSDNELATNFYSELDTAGLKFGPHFRSLYNCSFSTSGASTLLLAYVKGISLPKKVQKNRKSLHPVIIDAMLQGIIMSKFNWNDSGSTKIGVLIPSTIETFIWLAQPVVEDLYLAVRKNERNQYVSLLFDGTGMQIAVICGVELIKKAVSTMEDAVRQKRSSCQLAEMWEETWEPQSGSLQHRVNLEKWSRLKTGDFMEYNDAEFFGSLSHKYRDPGESVGKIIANLNKLTYYNVLRGLYNCGMETLSPGEHFSEEMLFKKLGIVSKHRRLFALYMDIFQAEGLVGRNEVNRDTIRVKEKPPTLEELLLLANDVWITTLASNFKSALLLTKLGENLSKILQGKMSPLPILFPKKSNELSMDLIYKDFYALNKFTNIYEEVVTRWLHQFVETTTEKPILRILEIGAGTGSLTKVLLACLDTLGIEFHYTFTDISSSFFESAEEQFRKWKEFMVFRKFNAEEDPLEQGFIPEYFDYICALDVIHATKDIISTLGNLRLLLRPFGRLDVCEITEKVRFATLGFGTLDGFWRFEDFDLRKDHCMMSVEGWTRAATSAGYHVIGVASTLAGSDNGHSVICCEKLNCDETFLVSGETLRSSYLYKKKTWLVFAQKDSLISQFLLRKMRAVKSRNILRVHRGSHFEISGDKATIRSSVEEDMELLIEFLGRQQIQLEGIVYCWLLGDEETFREETVRTLFCLTKSIIKTPLLPRKLITLTSGLTPIEGNRLSMTGVYSSLACGFLKSFQTENPNILTKCIDIGNESNTTNSMLQVFHEMWEPEMTTTTVCFVKGIKHTTKLLPHKVELVASKLPISSQRFQLEVPKSNFIEDLKFTQLLSRNLEDSHVEVQVKAYGLNFRDIIHILKPSDRFKESNEIGVEFSGVITRVGKRVKNWTAGDRVFGLNFRSFQSHLKVKAADVFLIPERLSFPEAATLPVNFATAYYCLVEVAKLKDRESVLIHTASGGVGLCAIQLCRYFNCMIICTAGSIRKRRYLRSLGIEHVFNSRDTCYSNKILKLTKSRGIDVVLNSLTSDGFKEATLLCCAKHARFVEMGKLSIWMPEEVKRRRSDVQYDLIDVTTLGAPAHRRLMAKLIDFLSKGIITPLPYTRFECVYIRQALQHMQMTQHIGKVVCVLPEQNSGRNSANFFHSQGTYLITGGMGGIGFQVCQWMVTEGAKHIVLAGRNPPSISIQKMVEKLNLEYSANIKFAILNVSDFFQCENIINIKIPEMGFPPLKGVMHCAGTLSNGFIENLNWEEFSSSFFAKVTGTMNLHELTKNINLEHFVLFSSIASQFGLPGQSNHAAANNFLDAMAHYRHSVGLPATSVSWGKWGDVGVAAELHIPGLRTLTAEQGIACLDYALKSHKTHIVVSNMDSYEVLIERFPHLGLYFDKKSFNCSPSAALGYAMKPTSSEQFWRMFAAAEDKERKMSILKDELNSILRRTLKLHPSDTITETQPFMEMGVDSLMNIEIRNAIQALLGAKYIVGSNLVWSKSSIKTLAENVARFIEETG